MMSNTHRLCPIHIFWSSTRFVCGTHSVCPVHTFYDVQYTHFVSSIHNFVILMPQSDPNAPNFFTVHNASELFVSSVADFTVLYEFVVVHPCVCVVTHKRVSVDTQNSK